MRQYTAMIVEVRSMEKTEWRVVYLDNDKPAGYETFKSKEEAKKAKHEWINYEKNNV